MNVIPSAATAIRLHDGRVAFTGPIGPGPTFGAPYLLVRGFAGHSVGQQLPTGALGVVYEAMPSTMIRFLQVTIPRSGDQGSVIGDRRVYPPISDL